MTDTEKIAAIRAILAVPSSVPAVRPDVVNAVAPSGEAPPPRSPVVAECDGVAWTAEMVEAFARFRFEQWRSGPPREVYWHRYPSGTGESALSEAGVAAYAHFEKVARPAAGAKLDGVLTLPPQVMARAKELIAAAERRA